MLSIFSTVTTSQDTIVKPNLLEKTHIQCVLNIRICLCNEYEVWFWAAIVIVANANLGPGTNMLFCHYT